MTKKRILWIDYIKGLCMMAIIFNHIPGMPLLARLTYPFELIGFFFVGGYTLSLKRNWVNFGNVKFQRLVLPVFAFGFLNSVLALPVKNVDFVERLKGILLQMPGQYDDMWFVACLFTMELLIYPLLIFLKSTWMRVSLVLLGTITAIVCSVTMDILLPWHIINALLFLPIMLLGYLLSNCGLVEVWRNEIWIHAKLVLIPIILYLISVLVFDNWPIDIHLLQYGNVLAFVVSSISGLWMVLSVSMWLEQFGTSKWVRALQFIGINSLAFYGMQSKVISMLVLVLTMTGIIACQTAFKLVVWIAALTILTGLSFIINRWFPFMVGEFNYKRK